MIEIIFNTTKTDLETIMMPWKAESLRFMWSKGGDVVTTKDLWEHIYPLYNISRTSINQFLKSMADAGVLENRPQTGKGGIHGRFSPKLDEEDFKGEVARTVLYKLFEFSPEGIMQFMRSLSLYRVVFSLAARASP